MPSSWGSGVKLCRQLDLTAEQLVEEWEAFSFNRKLPVDEPTGSHMDQFEIHKLKQKQFSKHKASPAPVVGKKRQATESRDEPDHETHDPQTSAPEKKKKKKEASPTREEQEESEATFEQRKQNTGKLITGWNSSLSESREPSQVPAISFPYGEQALSQDSSESIRYMHDPLTQRADSE